MDARIWLFAAGSCAFVLVACNEILDNRRGVLRREVEATETAPTQPPNDGSGTATTPGDRRADVSPPAGSGPDAATTRPVADAGSACPPGLEATSKTCGGQCVSVKDPSYGCAAADCLPCAIQGAIPACVNGACAIFMCEPGHADCNGIAADGCEADLGSTESCGTCSNVCPSYPHTIASCTGTCTIDCAPGWADCNGVELDGCETNLAEDPSHCGQCGHGCLLGVCMNGQCLLL